MNSAEMAQNVIINLVEVSMHREWTHNEATLHAQACIYLQKCFRLWESGVDEEWKNATNNDGERLP